MEVRCDDVISTVRQGDQDEDDGCDSKCSAVRCIAWTIEQMKLALISSDPLFDKWIESHTRKENSRNDQTRNQDIPGDSVAKGVCL